MLSAILVELHPPFPHPPLKISDPVARAANQRRPSSVGACLGSAGQGMLEFGTARHPVSDAINSVALSGTVGSELDRKAFAQESAQG